MKNHTLEHVRRGNRPASESLMHGDQESLQTLSILDAYGGSAELGYAPHALPGFRTGTTAFQ
jgi:hypothetical protein